LTGTHYRPHKGPGVNNAECQWERKRAGTGQVTVVPWLLQQGLSLGSYVVTCLLPRICSAHRVSSAAKGAFK